MTERDYTQSLQPLLDAFKAHIRMTSTDMDETLKLQLFAAVRSAEHYIGQIIARSSFTYTGTFAETVTLEAPVAAVSSVTVAGEALGSPDWSLSGNTLTLDVEADADDSLVVVYTAGPACIEPDIKAAILLHAAALFNNPVDSVETLPKASTRLLDPYRTWGV